MGFGWIGVARESVRGELGGGIGLTRGEGELGGDPLG